ncbi:glutamate 5-kinase [Vibrio vulnificus]|uniref:Glutamate 5-kinase n=1 Tax=Vibrio vulnificus TaxID=672 RepID=A0ABX4WYE5_VIBVL|nr:MULTISPECIES: glutamate 5-kinase [Vibrio]ASC56285.1 Glutamate 5-kinase / RNA-binding C-terminal domain PUA [Vibrio vulnificus]AVW99817.1 glutamate 5-kinase [Vibrio vulnificus Env1]EGQ7693781.1 glutamate 5-kinase [Vibrio vulnificus]EGQ7757911.1 glutamate 5-kinase [Vibrio vulnificus]EGQ7760223.1 glutamate 5-kinase [Vibrio vulnificus]
MTTNQQSVAASQPKTIVVKLGTSVLTGGTLALDRAHMVELARQCAELKKQGHSVVVVSSGAIAAGREHLGYPALPNAMASKQLLAAVGQSQLIQTWESLFALYGIKIGQMLLTRADLEDRERFLNARDTINALVENGIIPVVNENDAVATSEIKVGDNDNLSALVGILCGADKLLLLTDQKGLYTADPRKDPNAELIKEVKVIDDTLRKIAGGSGTTLGTGGMATKLQAADIARRAGIEVIIAAGRGQNVIFDALSPVPQGTRFLPCEEALENRKRWILAGPAASGDIVIDQGAVKAVVEKGSSLLAKGVTKVLGEFSRGEVVRVTDAQGHLVARGIASYSNQDMAKIAGKHSKDIISILGYDYGSEVIHRDDMVVIQE